MKICLENCNSIDYGEIQIKEKYLNIKYGINGTGKSTISNAIDGLINNSLDTLIPFKYYAEKSVGELSDEHKPNVEIYEENKNSNAFRMEDSPIKSVRIFNENYVDKFTLIGDDVVPNSFEIYVKTLDYEKKMKEIDSLIKEIKDFFKNNVELDDIIARFDLFLKKIVKPGKQKACSTTSPLYKALNGGNKTIDVPSEFQDYKGFISRTDSGQWASWHENGKDYFDWSNDTKIGVYKFHGNPSVTESISEELKSNTNLVINFANPSNKDFEGITKYLRTGKMLVDWLDDWRKRK